MKVRCITPFDDLKEHVPRNAGDEFEVDEKRLAELEAYAHARLVERVDERVEKPKPRKQKAKED